MEKTMSLPQLLPLPGEWPEPEAEAATRTARYEYRDGEARVTMSWPVTAEKTFSPQDEALAIATLLEQAQGFTAAFSLANLAHLGLFYQDGRWLPEKAAAPPLREATNGSSATHGAPPSPEPQPLPKSPQEFNESWPETRERMRREQEERRLRLAAAQRPSGMAGTAPSPPRETLDEAIERAEAEGRLLPTRPEAKPKPPRGKRLNYGQGMETVDQIYRLMKKVARPVEVQYVAKQLGISYESARKNIQRLITEGHVTKIDRAVIGKGTAWHDYALKETK